MTKSKTKKLIIIGGILFILYIIVYVYNSQYEKELLENGIETIGVVEKKLINKGHTPDGRIHFRYIDYENHCVSHSISRCSQEQAKEAITGRVYRVRYIGGKSGKTATIYIDEPIAISNEDFWALLESLDAD